MKSTTYAVAVLLVLASFDAGLWVKAGDLNPPAGPIVPTMHSLDEVYGAVAALNAPRTVVSYYGAGTGEFQIATADATRGLVVTDIIFGERSEGGAVYLYQGDPSAGGQIKHHIPNLLQGVEGAWGVSLASGIPFDPGSGIYVKTTYSTTTVAVTLSGYVPSGT